MRSLFPTLMLCLWSVAAVHAHQTPGDRNVYQYQPYEWHIGNSGDTYAATAIAQGYLVLDARQIICSEYPPDINLDVYFYQLSNGYGIWFQATHGSRNGCAVESYCGTPAGLQSRDDRYNWYLANGYSSAQIYTSYIGQPGQEQGYHISIRPGAIASQFVSDNTIVYNASCEGQLYADEAWGQAVTSLGYIDDVYMSTANSEADTFWGNMNGYGGVTHRSADWAHMALTIFLSGNGQMVLAPAVVGTTLTGNQQVPSGGSGISFGITLDAECETSVPVNQVLSVAGTTVTISGLSWSGTSTVTGMVSGVENEYGSNTLVMVSDYVYSAQNALAHLDGDGVGGPDDWEIGLKHDNNPAAVIEGFHWAQGVLVWIVASEYETAGYRIEGRNPPEEAWCSVGDLQPPGAGVRTLAVGDGFSEYRLVEIETNGREIIGNIVRAETPGGVESQVERTLEDLRAAFEARIMAGPERGGNGLLNGEKLIIFCPAAWTTHFTQFASYLNGWYGVTTQVVSIEQFGAPENRYPGIKGRIAELYGQGYRYVLLAGDASDWQYFDGPYTPDWWPTGPWENIRQGYLSGGFPEGGDPELNIIPVVMVHDQLLRGQNIAYYQPYYQLNDMLSYGDINDDTLPDLAVGRWPITSEIEALCMLDKQLYYLDQGGWGYNYPYRVAVYLGNVNHQEAGDGTHAVATANAILGHFRPGTHVTQLLESQYPDTWQRIVAAANLWNQGDEVAIFVSSMGGRYYPGNFFHLMGGFTMDLIGYGTFTPVVIGASCGTANEYMTEWPTCGRTVSHRMLVADSRGAITLIGPSAGTVQEGNRVVGERIVQYLQADPSRPVGESVRLAIRDILLNTPPSDSDHITVAKSYQLLGFPLSPLNHHNYPVAVKETDAPLRLVFASTSPNPTGSRTAIRFALPMKGTATVRVFDVNGRLVQTIANGVYESGVHTVLWEPGQRIPSGLYYLRLQADGKVMTRSVTLLR